MTIDEFIATYNPCPSAHSYLNKCKEQGQNLKYAALNCPYASWVWWAALRTEAGKEMTLANGWKELADELYHLMMLVYDPNDLAVSCAASEAYDEYHRENVNYKRFIDRALDVLLFGMADLGVLTVVSKHTFRYLWEFFS